MMNFTVTRCSGEKGGPGEFCVEDEDGVEWQVTALPSKMVPGTVTCSNEIVCMNKRYECDRELRVDLQDAVKEFVRNESGCCGCGGPLDHNDSCPHCIVE